jgi:hypothetical protein
MPSGSVLLWMLDTDRFTIFTAEPDPADAAQFRIPFRINGLAGTIDGHVNDDGTTTLSISGNLARPTRPPCYALGGAIAKLKQ